MKLKTNFEQKLLILAIIFLPINHFRIDIPFIGTVLSKIFILAGMLLYVIKLVNGKQKLNSFERFSFFYLLVFFLWQCLCTVIGIQEFDYYALVSLEQMDKLRYFTQTLQSSGLPVTDVMAIKIWLCLRFLKDCLLYVIFSYGVSLWVFQMYKEEKTHPDATRTAVFSHLVLAVTVLCLTMTAYSIIEIGYLSGNLNCARILAKINPLLYEVEKLHGWWPPLLWKDQLRSLFAEPSFFGLASTMIAPFFIYKILNPPKRCFVKGFYNCIFILFVVMLFLTRARTALVLFIGQLFLFVFYVLLFKHRYFKKVLQVLLVVLFSFALSLHIMSGFKVVNLDSDTARSSNVTANASDYVSDNVASVVGNKRSNTARSSNVTANASDYVSDNVASVVGNKRSNTARFASVRATFLTGFQHPVFGVGMGLSTAYVNANFTRDDLNNNEVRNWSRYVEKEGVLKSPIPVLNQFSIIIANFGVMGLLFYLFPMFYIFFGIIKEISKGLAVEMACLIIAYIATVAAMLSNVAFLTYYIMTGVLLACMRMNNGRDENYGH